jgi:hypothetical protein
MGAGGLEASIGVDIGRLDYSGSSGDFMPDMIFGVRDKVWAGYSVIGGGYAWTKLLDGKLIQVSSVSIGAALAPMYGVSGGWNRGYVEPLKF